MKIWQGISGPRFSYFHIKYISEQEMEVYMSEEISLSTAIINSSSWDPAWTGLHTCSERTRLCLAQTHAHCLQLLQSYVSNSTHRLWLHFPGTPKWKRLGMLHLIFPSLFVIYTCSLLWRQCSIFPLIQASF